MAPKVALTVFAALFLVDLAYCQTSVDFHAEGTSVTVSQNETFQVLNLPASKYRFSNRSDGTHLSLETMFVDWVEVKLNSTNLTGIVVTGNHAKMNVSCGVPDGNGTFEDPFTGTNFTALVTGSAVATIGCGAYNYTEIYMGGGGFFNFSSAFTTNFTQAMITYGNVTFWGSPGNVTVELYGEGNLTVAGSANITGLTTAWKNYVYYNMTIATCNVTGIEDVGFRQACVPFNETLS